MIYRVSIVWAFLALILPLVSAHRSRRHQEVALRARGDVDLNKRQTCTAARFTFYDVGQGACGVTNVASDFIVAMNVDQYGSGYPGPLCFQMITIQYGGKTAQAQIMDKCMECPYCGLDFSRGLFDYFASESEGVIYGTWWFNDGSGGDGGGQQTTSSTWTPPTTTWEPPATTSTPDYTPPATSSTPDYTATSSTPAYTPPPTTSTTSTSSSSITSSTASNSTSSNNLSTGALSGLAVPTGGPVSTPNASNPENIVVINNILVDIGAVFSAMEKN